LPSQQRVVVSKELLAAALFLSLTSEPALAQLAPRRVPADEVFAGSEIEQYLRVLQVSGAAPVHPWSVRAFGPLEVTRLAPTDSTHPWHAHRGLWIDSVSGRAAVRLLAPEARTIYNSAFPYGMNDGAIWAGRGLTGAMQVGVAARVGPLSAVLAPQLFAAGNAEFPLMANGRTGRHVFADGRYPDAIDLPQRFGEGTYTRLDAGQSTVRADLWGVALGASTANQYWGPAVENPILLGNNAAGFPHAFVGTARPVNVWIGRLHGRVIWGQLNQSDYSPIDTAHAKRFAAGLALLLTPRGARGLELGIGRFFHMPWPAGGLASARFGKPFESFLKVALARQRGNQGNDSSDNQLASVFGRWVFPASGVEVYAEYGREDHNWDTRGLMQEPDHDAAYLFGFQKAWRRPASRLFVIRGEALNSRISHLQQAAPQVPWYIHSVARQGHTHDGQVLGSAGGFGGGAAVLAVDRYEPTGRWTIRWSRLMRGELRTGPNALPDADSADVMHTLGVERVLFMPHVDLTAGLTGVWNLNRDFADDVFGLNMVLAARWRM
jgi:hypothetical protein